MMYPVDTQEISSSVAPRFPIMWGIATFTMDVSISSSTAARVTAMAMRYLYLYLSTGTSAAAGMYARAVPRGPAVMIVLSAVCVIGPLFGAHMRKHRHARPQRMIL